MKVVKWAKTLKHDHAGREVLAYADYWDSMQGSDFSSDEMNRRLSEAEDAVIDEIRANGYCFGAGYHQHGDFGTPLLDNGKVLFCYLRQWGRIMYRAHNPNGNDPMGYCLYAFDDLDPREVKIPKM